MRGSLLPSVQATAAAPFPLLSSFKDACVTRPSPPLCAVWIVWGPFDFPHGLRMVELGIYGAGRDVVT